MNILIIDDHTILEDGIKNRILSVFPKATCHFSDNIRDAISKLQEIHLDLIICDLEFNNDAKIDGFYIIESLLKFEPRTKAIAFTNYNSYRVMKKAIKSGFMSFLDKSCTIEDFSNTLTNVLKNGAYKSDSMKQLLQKRNEFTHSIFSDSYYGISDLSKKELELTLLSKDTTDRKVLAKTMGNTPYTIDSYFKTTLAKLNLKSRKELAFFSKEFQEELLKK